jgi:hypothetical protein
MLENFQYFYDNKWYCYSFLKGSFISDKKQNNYIVIEQAKKEYFEIYRYEFNFWGELYTFEILNDGLYVKKKTLYEINENFFEFTCCDIKYLYQFISKVCDYLHIKNFCSENEECSDNIELYAIELTKKIKKANYENKRYFK